MPAILILDFAKPLAILPQNWCGIMLDTPTGVLTPLSSIGEGRRWKLAGPFRAYGETQERIELTQGRIADRDSMQDCERSRLIGP
jgi:hypothetical protein